MFNDFLVIDGQGASPEKPIERSELYVVLFRDNNSEVFRPMFHTNELRKAPRLDANRMPIWDNTAGAVDYINDHQKSAAGQYRIKNNKGEIV